MSSRLCKYGEGAGFPLQVESLEDGVEDAVDAGYVHETDHGPGATAHFHEAALDYVGGAQLLAQVRGESEHRKQFRQIALQLAHHRTVLSAPAGAEGAKRRFGLGAAFGPVDGLGLPVHRLVVPLPYFL